MLTKSQRAEAAAKTLQQTGSLLKAAGAFVFPSSMTFSGLGSWLSIAPRNFPYQNTDPLTNSAVVNVLGWITRNFGQGEFKVCKQKRDGSKEPITNHPLQQLLERPNGFYGGQTLWAGLMFSYHLDGNAYLIKERNARGFGIPTSLWYVPHWLIKPAWPQDGSKFISHYEYSVNGKTIKLPIENVIHIRNGLNPVNTRYGLAPLKAALLQIYTDNEVTAWAAALCRNMAIPGVVVNPTENIGMTPEKAKKIKETWVRKFGGDNRGEPLILDFNATVTPLGFDPSQMDFKGIHNHAESRIAGALGVPPQLAFLDVANDSSSYNNLTTFERIGFEQCIIPSYENIEDALDAQLLVDFESDPLAKGIFCEFDTDDIAALKEDADKKEARAASGLKSGALLVDEYRAAIGLAPLPNNAGQILLIPNNARPATPDNLASRAAQEITDPKVTPDANSLPDSGQEPKQLLPVFSPPQAIVIHMADAATGKALPIEAIKAYEWEGLTLRREPNDLEKLCIKALIDQMETGKRQIEVLLAAVRLSLIEDFAAQLAKLSPENYDAAAADVSASERASLLALLTALWANGAGLILSELRQQGAEPTGATVAPVEAEIEAVATAILTQLTNDVKARAVAAAVAASLLGSAIGEAVRSSLRDGSTGYVSRSAASAANVALARGRDAELNARREEIQFLVYSAVLDSGTCQPCGDWDGKTGDSTKDLPRVPNPDCEGGAQCRCVIIPVRKAD